MSIRRVVPIEEAEWRIEPAPAWAETREPDWGFAPSDEYPFAFLLIDEQHDVTTQSVFSRGVRRLLNHAAVQALGQVELEFDPAAHRLLIHELAVWRDGAGGVWEKHAEARREGFLLRQREQQLEQQMLTGRVSLVALLEDVRVGDAIDLAWTLEPRDRLPGQRFTTFFAFGWNVPVARAFMSLRQDPAAPVEWLVHAAEGIERPTERVDPGGVTWEAENPRVLKMEPNAPGSSWPCAVIDVSGWSSWAEVAGFFAALWEDALADGSEAIAAEVQRLRGEQGGGSLVREVIRFVQEDVRYLSVDFGSGAGMLPSGAGSVLRRRFGDCKDKAVLLAALLRALGFDACPMLVAENWRTAIQRTQASSGVFSHAIVSLVAEGERRFVDPTFIGQGGDLDHLTPPPYGCGLEVREGSEALVTLPDRPTAELSVIETFDLDRKQQDGWVEQVMHARGPLADDVRAALVREGPRAFARARAEALQTHFPALVPSEAPAAVSDDLEANVIEVRARHGLPTWGPIGQKPPPLFSYGAHALFYAVEPTEGPDQRLLPWALPYPMHAHHRVVVRGRCIRKVKAGKQRFGGPGFEYTCDVKSVRHQITFDYRWKTTQSEISPEQWPDYCRDRAQALSQAGASVVTKPRAPAWQWAVGAALGAALGVGAGHLRDAREEGSRVTREAGRRVPGRAEEFVRAARQAMDRGDANRAASLLAEVAPHYAEAHGFHVMRAEAAIRSGRLEDARQAIAAARRLDPSDPQVRLQQARVAELTGDLAAARRGAAEVLEGNPNDSGALLLAARIEEQMGDDAGALRGWERLLSLHPAHPDALLSYALLLWKLGERERADSVMQGVVRAQPTASPRLEAALSSYLDATGRPDEAVAPAGRAADLAPNDPRFAHRHAIVLLRAGDAVAAFAAAERMTERFPGHPLAHGALAIVASATGRNEVAASAFEAWLELEPRNPSAVANYGFFLHQTGRSEMARGYFEQATRDFPGSGIVWLNYATVLAALGDVDAAAEAQKRAATLTPARERATLIR